MGCFFPLLGEPVAPQTPHLLNELVLRRVFLPLPNALPLDLGRQVILLDEMVLIIMGIFVFLPVVQLRHQFRRRVPQMQRHGQIAGTFHQGERVVDRLIGRVALGAARQVNRRFR